MPNDHIILKGLEIFAYHGVYPEEQKNGQKFYINAALCLDTRKAGQSDDLAFSVHYGEVCHFIDRFMKEHTFCLLETVAERMSEALLLAFPLLESVRLEICKPDAPIGLPFSSVSVEIERGWHTAYIALGSNMGDRRRILEEAVAQIKQHALFKVGAISSFIVTKPYGGVEQEDFLNAAMQVKTLLLPEELLEFLQQIEQRAGRERLVHWGPRTLDLDILFYDDIVYDSRRLTIPHADMHNRDFVLMPMNEIAPYKRHTVLGKTVCQMLEELQGAPTFSAQHLLQPKIP